MEYLISIFGFVFACGVAHASVLRQEEPSTGNQSGQDCGSVLEREKCLGIVQKAVEGFSTDQSLHDKLQLYCRKIPGFVPCLEENMADFMLLMDCYNFEITAMTQLEPLLTQGEIWNLAINALDEVNHIICSRTDEIVELVECLNQPNNDSIMEACQMAHPLNVFKYMSPYNNSRAELDNKDNVCDETYGWGRCIKNGFRQQCGDTVTGLLEALYENLIVKVIGSALGCEE